MAGPGKYNTQFILFLFLHGCLFVLLSCANHKHPDKKIFHYNESSGLATLDPAFAKNKQVMWSVHQLYNTLVEIDSNMQVRPSLASHWEISPDNRTFTFHLRPGIFYTDDPCFPGSKGRALNARDVVFSFHRIMDKQTASPGAWIFNNRVDSLEPFTAISDSVFQLKLARPFHSILGILSMQYCSIVPEEAVRKYGADFRRHPVGTGPFRLLARE